MSDRKRVKSVLSRLDHASLTLLADEFAVKSSDQTKSQLIANLLAQQNRVFQRGGDSQVIRQYVTDFVNKYRNRQSDDVFVGGVDLDGESVEKFDLSDVNDDLYRAIATVITEPQYTDRRLDIRVDPIVRFSSLDESITENPIFEVRVTATNEDDQYESLFRENMFLDTVVKILKLLSDNNRRIYDSREETIPLFANDPDDDDDDDFEEIEQRFKRART
jgi:hypothetical protein